MSDEAVLLEVEGGVGWLTLNRPATRNLVDFALAEALADAAGRCAEDDRVRCVVLTGSGRFFSAGGDIGFFADADAGADRERLVADLARALHEGVRRLTRMPKPLVTAVNGSAAGAGFSLAVLGDVALAARSATFTMAYTRIGLTPDGGASWMLPRLVGLRRAQELILTNRQLDAEAAAAMGLITRVVDDAELPAAAADVAQQLAAAPISALAICRQLMLEGAGSAFEEQLDRETVAIGKAAGGFEGVEGVSAFLEKRPPRFDARR